MTVPFWALISVILRIFWLGYITGDLSILILVIDYDLKGLHPSRQRKHVRSVRTQRMITYVDRGTSILKVTCHL